MNLTLSQVTQRLNAVATDLCRHAENLESGKAVTPHQDEMARLSHPWAGGMLTAVVIELGIHAAARTLATLFNETFFTCKPLVPTTVPCYLISAQGTDCAIEAKGETTTFESIASLSGALESNQEVPSDKSTATPLDLTQIRLPAVESLLELNVYVPGGVEALRQFPQLLSLISDEADLVILVGYADSVIEDSTAEILDTLLTAVGALQCVFLPGAEDTHSTPSWSRRQPVPFLSLPPVKGSTSPVKALTEGSHFVIAIREHSRLRRIEGCAEILREALQGELRTFQTRRRLLEVPRPSSTTDESGPNGLRGITESILKPLMEDLDALRRDRDDQTARAIQPSGKLFESVQDIVEGIDIEDLRQEHAGQSIRLSVGPEINERLRCLVRQGVAGNLSEDAVLITDVLETNTAQIADSVAGRTGFRKVPVAPVFDHARACSSLDLLNQINIRYRGELPRPTWKARFAAARNSMMGVSIFMMLCSGIGVMMSREGTQALRNGLYIVMLFAFITGFITSFAGLKRLQAEAMDREIEKLRDSVMSELIRLLQNLMSEKRRMLAEFLQRVSRELEKQVTEQLQTLNLQRRRDQEIAQQTVTEKARVLQQRMQGLQNSLQGCDRAIGELAQMHRQLAQAITEMSRPVTPSSTATTAGTR